MGNVIIEDQAAFEGLLKMRMTFPTDFSPITKEKAPDAYDAIKESKRVNGIDDSDVIVKVPVSKAEEVNKNDTVINKEVLEKAVDEKVDVAFNKLLDADPANFDKEIGEIANAIEEAQDKSEDAAIMEQAKIMPAEPGETKTVMVNVNPATGERNINGNGEFKEDSASFDELLETESDDISDAKLDDTTITSEVRNKYVDISDTDAATLTFIAKKYRANEIDAKKAFEMLPDLFKSKIDHDIREAGIPVNNIESYRRSITKSIIESIISDAEIEQCTVNFDNQIAKIYKEYGNDVAYLYQSNIYEKIKTMRQTISEMEKDNEDGHLDEKIETIHCIIDSMYESFEMNEFGEFAIRKKIKSIEQEKSHRIFRDFNGKYDNSKFSINDVTLIIEALTKYCNCTEDDARDFAILFCKYCINMHPSKLEEHTFMYYFISNIISLSVNGIKDANDENEFGNILTTNINNILKLRKEYFDSNRTADVHYEAKVISEEYMENVMLRAAERTKEIEAENDAMEKELAEENTEETDDAVETEEEESNE